MRPLLFALAAALSLAACTREPFVVTRSACPAVAVPQYAGEATLFQPVSSRNASDIDLVAALTNVRGACSEAGSEITTTVSYQVVAQRRDATAARTVVLPVFAAVVQAGDTVIAKEVGGVQLSFEPGQARAVAQGGAQVGVNRAAATLPEEIEERITREREPGDPDAALDPMADPQVRDAVRRASFEVLVGFQLDDAALAYNALK